jgi:hypothetical protein
MTCIDTNVCENNVGTELCDSFSAVQVDFFADSNLSLGFGTAGVHRYDFDGKERLWRNRVLSSLRPGMTVRVTVTSTEFDPVLYIFDTVNATCAARLRAVVDNPTDGTAPEVALITTNDGSDIDLVTTTFASVGGQDEGDFTLRTRGVLCAGTAFAMETTTQQVYDQCFRAFELNPGAFTCGESNPCARDATGATTGQICCMKPDGAASGDCRDPGDPLNQVFFQDYGPNDGCG